MKMFSFVIWLLWFVMLIPHVTKCENVKSITIATYNVWNIMFNWNVRKFRIAQMVSPEMLQLQSPQIAGRGGGGGRGGGSAKGAQIA